MAWSRTQHIAPGDARTSDTAIAGQARYHRAPPKPANTYIGATTRGTNTYCSVEQRMPRRICANQSLESWCSHTQSLDAYEDSSHKLELRTFVRI